MFPLLFCQTLLFSFICAPHQAHEVIPLRQQKNPGCMGNEWLRKPGPNALDTVKMASPAGTHAFLRHALWPHESMTVQKTWAERVGEGAGSRPLKCSTWQSHCLRCPLSHLPAQSHTQVARMLASFLPSTLLPFHLVLTQGLSCFFSAHPRLAVSQASG